MSRFSRSTVAAFLLIGLLIGLPLFDFFVRYSLRHEVERIDRLEQRVDRIRKELHLPPEHQWAIDIFENAKNKK